MFKYYRNRSPKKSTLTFLGVSILSSFLSLHVSAQNMQDDLALVDGMLRIKSKGLDLEKELDIHLRLLKERYPENVLTIQRGKILYSKDQKTGARAAFGKVPASDPSYGEMVFTFFKYASEKTDLTGQRKSASLYFESNLKAKIPQLGTERRAMLMDMVDIYIRAVKKEEDPKIKKEKLKELQAWGTKNNIEIPNPPPTQEMEDANNIAEKIVMGDRGVEKDAKVNIKLLEKLIKDQIEAEWGDLDYWFFKGVVERARSQVLLGRYDEGLATLKKFTSKFKILDDDVFKAIDEDKKVKRADKPKVKKASSIFSGVRYVKGLANFLKARTMKNKKNMKGAQELLRGKTGAAAQFGLCIYHNKGSKEAFKAILRYDRCRDTDIKWFPKEPKRLRELDKKPFYVKNIDLGKAYYNLQDYPKAAEYFTKYKTAAVSEDAYDAVYYCLWANFEGGKREAVDEYLGLLETKFISMNKKPKDWYTQSCLRLSGKYRTLKNEEADPVKKKEYENKQLEYFERSTRGGGTAPIVYLLAYKKLKTTFDLKRSKKFKEAKEMYKVSVQAFEALIKRFPSSPETVKSYRQLGLLHEYFKDLKASTASYKACLAMIATPDVIGRIEKVDIMTSLANVQFLDQDYESTLVSLIEIDKYIKSESFETKDDKSKAKMVTLEEKRETLRLFSEDNVLVPKKKEYRVIKSELRDTPDDAALKAKAEKVDKEIKEGLASTVVTFQKWLVKFPKSPTKPVVMARLGSLYQELGDSLKAKSVYEKLKGQFPDHEVVKQISINIVRAHLKNEDFEAAADALKDTDLSKLDDDGLRYLVNAFVVRERPKGMSTGTMKVCSAEAVKIIDLLRPRYVKAEKDINDLHWLDLRKAISLNNLGKLEPTKAILDTMAKEKPYGPYIFDVKYLLGSVASKLNDFVTVGKIYGSLKALSQRMDPDLNREVRISVEWSSAYENVVDNEKLLKKARGLAMMTKSTNREKLSPEGDTQYQKSWYLFILYSKKLKKDIVELKTEFLQKFPSSRYSLKVRRL